MTLPRVKSDLLMYPVSLAPIPSDLLLLSCSLPARSTKLILPSFFITDAESSSHPSHSMCTDIIEWLRLESLFRSWLPTDRFTLPSSSTASTSSTHSHSITRSSST